MTLPRLAIVLLLSAIPLGLEARTVSELLQGLVAFLVHACGKGAGCR